MSAHTPGPWSLGYFRKGDNVRSWNEQPIHVGEGNARGNCLAVVGLGGPGAIYSSQELIEANARLIAAAPDLLNILNGIVVLCEESGEPVDGFAFRERILAGRAAIARATGEQS